MEMTGTWKFLTLEEVSPEVLERWNRDIATINESLALMLANELAAAEQKLDEAVKEVEQRSIDFKAGEHDLRGCFAFVRQTQGRNSEPPSVPKCRESAEP